MSTNPHESPNTVALGADTKPATHGRAIVVALVQQAFILLLAALMLDGGRLIRALSGALIITWVISLVVMLRCRDHPTPLSIAVVKYGFWFAIGLLLLLGPLVGLPIFGG